MALDRRWTSFERKPPADRSICTVLVELASGDLQEEFAIFHKELGKFIMRATQSKPCGTKGRVLFWKVD